MAFLDFRIPLEEGHEEGLSRPVSALLSLRAGAFFGTGTGGFTRSALRGDSLLAKIWLPFGKARRYSATIRTAS